MRQILRYLFGTAQRARNTAIVGMVLWAMIDPQSVRHLVAVGCHNFWTAFGPLFQQLLQLLIVGGVIWFLVKNLFKKSK